MLPTKSTRWRTSLRNWFTILIRNWCRKMKIQLNAKKSISAKGLLPMHWLSWQDRHMAVKAILMNIQKHPKTTRSQMRCQRRCHKQIQEPQLLLTKPSIPSMKLLRWRTTKTLEMRLLHWKFLKPLWQTHKLNRKTKMIKIATLINIR